MPPKTHTQTHTDSVVLVLIGTPHGGEVLRRDAQEKVSGLGEADGCSHSLGMMHMKMLTGRHLRLCDRRHSEAHEEGKWGGCGVVEGSVRKLNYFQRKKDVLCWMVPIVCLILKL